MLTEVVGKEKIIKEYKESTLEERWERGAEEAKEVILLDASIESQRTARKILTWANKTPKRKIQTCWTERD